MLNRIGIVASLFFAFCCADAHADQAFVAGPVEAVSPAASRITVLGQTFEVVSAGSLTTLSTLRVAPAKLPQAGDYVVVTGLRLSDGRLIAKSFRSIGGGYVPGASNVYLSGRVTGFNLSLGTIRVGDVEVYANDALVNSSVSVEIGSQVEILGRQSQSKGLIWATEVAGGVTPLRRSNEVLELVQNGFGISTSAIQGTGVQAIQGTGVQAIQGTGVQAIQGTGVQAIQGTGAQAIQGTGVQAIQGAGVQAIQGTGVQAIQGTGVQAIQGTGVQAIQGTGVQAIQGTGVQAIQGTGIF